MPEIIEYQRNKATDYARQWAFKRNPKYFDFSDYGGDCTNFISQCLFAGSDVMNEHFYPYWFYLSSFLRSASWAGVNFLFEFLTQNQNLGPYGRVCNIDDLQLGDIVQLKFLHIYEHSLIVTKILKEKNRQPNDILIATHTRDAFDKPISYYVYNEIRFIKIMGVYI